MTMTRSFLSSALLLLALSLFVSIPSPAAAAKGWLTLDLPSFDGVEVLSVATMDIRVGGSQTVKVKAEDWLLDALQAEVKDGVLSISLDRKVKTSGRDTDIEFNITVPELRSLDVSGVATIDVADVQAKRLEIDIDGVATLDVSGSVDFLELSINGVGTVDLEDLQAVDAHVSIDGVGNADVRASGSVDASVDGMGKLRIHGDPLEVKERVNGFGRVKRIHD